jgi:recombination protein RecT
MSNLTVQQKQNLTAVKNVLNSDSVKARIQEMLGRKPDSYITSVLQVLSSNAMLAEVNAETITGAVFTACALNLPLNNNLGLAYIVPFKGSAQLQIGYKGFIQLAQRTGQIKSINAIAVYDTDTEESALKRLTSILPQKVEGRVIGYVARLETITGFEAHVSMTNEELEQHADKYSQTYKAAKSKGKTYSVWHQNWDAMCKKTVIKGLMKYCPMSVELNRALESDQGVINQDGDIDYADNKEEIRTLNAEKVPAERFEEFLNAIEAGNLSKEQALNPEVFDLTPEQRAEVVKA